ncbi:chromosome partitioning nuclease protein ParB [Acetobacter pasteurianus NBRC 3280]|uniref:Chromosome partitioning nuclease protein ParB n=2 Tax=Acetobacter pasteurianus TaxID=438 RepID=A0A401X9I2_ACEPA|nr:chromosome partitioning nuclease protein ParB [Acetobacter pasteurianus NBRC 3277]GCD64329.1 chromosome partitioning nuclease protein ParB [Acetobacter pasteurianus NBRC 3278]GCD70673.1 chromosome partitioning nuclease protein ParB [Acetobacter pasteurianus NBRC 3280]
MTESEQWRGVLDMREKGATDTEICRAFMVTPAYLRGLMLLSQIHPPIIAAIDGGIGPSYTERNAIARTPLERQRDVWAEIWAESADEGSDPADYEMSREDAAHFDWSDFVRYLDQVELYARDYEFDDETAKEAGVVWEEDLFGQGGEDNRYCTQYAAMFKAQQIWAEKTRPEGTIYLQSNEYGEGIAPDGYRKVGSWEMERDGDIPAIWVNPRTLQIQKGRLRELGEQSTRRTESDALSLPSAQNPEKPKERADISGTGLKIIGEVRTQALREALAAARESADPWDLIGAFLLALSADNVNIHGDNTYDPYGAASERDRAVASVFPEGVLVRDPAVLRNAALEVLCSFMNCEVSMHSGSGLPAQILGVLFNADAHMPTMAFEDFLKTYSKPGITKAVQAEGLEEKPTGKAMREALMAHVGEKRWVPEPATFATGIPAWKAKIKKQAARAAARAQLDAQTEEDDEIDDQSSDMEHCDEQDVAEADEETLTPEEDVSADDTSSVSETTSSHTELPDDPRIPTQLAELARKMPEHLEIIMV